MTTRPPPRSPACTCPLYKVLTFGISAGIAAVGGWMFAVLNNQVSPTSFTIVLSITLLVAAVLGGANSIIGPVIGAVHHRVPARSDPGRLPALHAGDLRCWC